MASTYRPPMTRFAYAMRGQVVSRVEAIGFALAFVLEAFVAIPTTLRRYRSQTMLMITDMTWGRGSLVVGGGTVPVLVILGVAIGAGVGIQGYSLLSLIGLEPLTGVVSAFANTRELAPIAAAVGFAAQAGCRMTAEIGAMRISEEINALEALGLRSIPFVVTTRILAGAVCVVPTFLVTLLLSYFSAAAVVTVIHGASSGVYGHYFDQFANIGDIVAATVKMLVFSIAVILIHCYQGFFATGGPEGVGMASGRAIRASFIAIIGLDMVLTLLIWGVNSSIVFSG